MIRKATPADAAVIARIINEAFEVEREFREGERTSPEKVRELMARDAFLVAEEAARTIGAVYVRIDGRIGYFGMLAVDPSMRRAGIGRALVEAAEALCRTAGCTTMTMSTGEDRTELIPYYQHQGYQVVSIEPSTSSDFKRPIRVVTMQKPLT
jgi:ribosomal protein S18 acetylase RimI-like enzyme